MQYKEIKEGFEPYEFRQGEPVGEPVGQFDLPANTDNNEAHAYSNNTNTSARNEREEARKRLLAKAAARREQLKGDLVK